MTRMIAAVAVAWGCTLGVAAAAPVARPIVGFRVQGHSKVTRATLGYLAHVHVGDPVSDADIPQLEEALISSELFKTAVVTLEDGPDGITVVATVDDKLSWIAAPTIFVLPKNYAFGVGYGQSDLGGRAQKLLLYGQLGTHQNMALATLLDPSVHGSPLVYRVDLYLEQLQLDEYANPPGDPRSTTIARTTRETFLDAGALVGWNLAWWAVADLRLRGAYVYFRDARDASGALTTSPEKDGWDVSTQARLTLDHRAHRFGVTTGAYAQAMLETSVPELDSYGYGEGLARAFYSWELFDRQELELRGTARAGIHLPIQDELALGGVASLRGYPTERFRGDVIALARAEYSVPILTWSIFAFRALGFADAGTAGFHFSRSRDRAYLSDQLGPSVLRTDVGVGLRVYVAAVVLPLLGIDLGYGIEGHSPEVYFELGITDF